MRKGYDYTCYRRWLHQRGITPRIARRGQEFKERLGRYRWVVEQTIGWLHRYRRLRIRYEAVPRFTWPFSASLAH
jgi:hypothetical protein